MTTTIVDASHQQHGMFRSRVRDSASLVQPVKQ